MDFLRNARVTTWIVLLCFVSAANAEIRNEAQIHDASEICQEYLDYLAGGLPEASDACSPIERLLIDGADLEFRQFLEHFESEANPNSALSYMLQGLSAYLIGAGVEAFYFLDEADRAIFSGFQSIGDVERATLYSSLMSEIKLEIVSRNCGSGYQCHLGFESISSSDNFGEQVSGLDEVLPYTMLYCLVRYDAYSIPVRQVLTSSAFTECAGG